MAGDADAVTPFRHPGERVEDSADSRGAGESRGAASRPASRADSRAARRAAGRGPSHAARREMVEQQLRPRGIEDPRVLEAMAEIPRERFLPVEQAAAAYEDAALPLAEGQTLSQPFMVAAMTEALQLKPDNRVLEIGTGSGYQTAVLSRLAGEVFTIEYIEGLSRAANDVLRDLGCTNVHPRVGDGSRGWPEEAPFDAILVTAGAPSLPEPLKRQVNERGGRIVIPVGPRKLQTLFRYTRWGSAIEAEALMECRFVPLLGEEGWGQRQV